MGLRRIWVICALQTKSRVVIVIVPSESGARPHNANRPDESIGKLLQGNSRYGGRSSPLEPGRKVHSLQNGLVAKCPLCQSAGNWTERLGRASEKPPENVLSWPCRLLSNSSSTKKPHKCFDKKWFRDIVRKCVVLKLKKKQYKTFTRGPHRC